MTTKIELIGLSSIPEVKAGDDVAKLIYEAAVREGVGIREGDIIVITHKIVSKANGLIVDLRNVKPSEKALEIAEMTGKDPRFVEVILREAKRILDVRPPFIITETHFGHICLNAGVDRSNVAGSEEICALLPRDPDEEARKIRGRLMELTGLRKIAVVISDTYSRPHRYAQIDMAIGIAGLNPIVDYKGRRDAYGYQLRFKMQAIGDELAAAAELAIGQTVERVPVVIIRGYNWTLDEEGSAKYMSLIKLGYSCIFEGVPVIPEKPGLAEKLKRMGMEG
ncbi:MAG: coenzyme F420-0:L-glutamate ligase [archaeon YNP-LCB-003-016]|jgi:coenzyme F420-0:L-glutamate ligase/coenzyme F420-1:gamma-L-glutamate ligase|uniref:coenzyme F420-0:L-glutamate ligase n=1 Tax=Candidatus Culexarchaeum yellowstonense TaxID=2928963 RepID=UPI0026E96F3A|nr:coenzyme F420-0:L-glutamate ligase [Candidatus Culexarchaeum yellowstonense]MCR6691998.1 coenzyme F420-0:L-glutamate ligase [Candidatus Culexarchaeum yellowstonense]